ncbi:hypothetical protein CRG98_029962 [Punica granatum]|uniref:Uncharacterized protein n=1 Tax=Punica granatum TaxID=22663 RepID=A0A2I0J072_PUNGR|nr:hypothetical protein CRG98_029962 [Punica granatum]
MDLNPGSLGEDIIGDTLLLEIGIIGYFYVFAIYSALLVEAKLASTENSLDIATMEIESIIGTILLEIITQAISKAVILGVLLVIAVISKSLGLYNIMRLRHILEIVPKIFELMVKLIRNHLQHEENSHALVAMNAHARHRDISDTS